MAKTKTPFLSLGSSGTVGGFLTSQKSGSATLLREKPVPTDPYSLPQAYHRWDYQDGAAYWATLSDATKASWRTIGSRHHMTGFAAFMRDYLNNLTDLEGRWRLDAIRAGTTPDSSKKGLTATVVGCSVSDGRISNCFYFDGLNDYCLISPYPTGSFTAFSILFWMKTPAFDGTWRAAIGWSDFIVTSYTQSMCNPTANLIYHWLANTAGAAVATWGPFTPDTWELHGWVWDGTTISIVRNSSLLNPIAIGGVFSPSCDLYFGRRTPPVAAYWYDGYTDHISMFNRALTTIDLQRHSERRYP